MEHSLPSMIAKVGLSVLDKLVPPRNTRNQAWTPGTLVIGCPPQSALSRRPFDRVALCIPQPDNPRQKIAEQRSASAIVGL